MASGGFATPPGSPGVQGQQLGADQQAAQGQAAGVVLAGQQFELDTKSVAKLTAFSGKDRDYPEWGFTASATDISSTNGNAPQGVFLS